MTKKTIYYPALDGLRFFAFLFVFLHHSLSGLSSNNTFLNFVIIAFTKNGWIGVDLFFVLSGFLITTLLLNEKRKNGHFSLKNFYIRRALRIWPLYYLMLTLGFFILPYLYRFFLHFDYSANVFSKDISTQLPLYFTFLGNWGVVFFGYLSFANISHLWTISIEEQFYLLWPLLLLFINTFKRGVLICSIIIVSALTIRAYLFFQQAPYWVIYTNTLTRMDTLIYGALVALILFYRNNYFKKINYLLKSPLVVVSIIVLVYLMYRTSFLQSDKIFFSTLGYNLIDLFMVYYLLVTLYTNSILNKTLCFKPFVWLGKISYGLYVWHLIALELSFQILRNFGLIDLKPLLALALTVFFATVSYYLYEIQFLKLKSKFSSIKSRPL